MEETRKREDDNGKATAAEDDMMTWMIGGEGEEFIAEDLMKLLEDDGGGGGGGDPSRDCPLRFIEDPYATSVIFQSATSPGYITINGNEESCGSSFSDSDASVMASVDARGLIGAWGSHEVEARGGSSRTNAFDDDDDDSLVRFIGEEDEDDCV
ncbi:PREDICTED: uncharacterized protein LOC104817754 [Tarenaya hassleriana]|uniref:uncharacterized protein LOC104817754 n=1 Tax=Tarenaya hassleriana TaxID=28532 RepID=UPI00053C7C19|nr:PREDICTED: uncharacterized protein LOC104817754 [Tarenaya hassleriana]